MNKHITDICLEIDYSLGNTTLLASDINNLGAIFEEYKMPNIPSLWGLEKIHINSLDEELFIGNSIGKYLDQTDKEKIKAIDHIIFCESRTLPFDIISRTVLKKLQKFGVKNCTNTIFISQLDCTNFMVAVDLARKFVSHGSKRVLIVGAESGFVNKQRICNYAAFSDFVGIISVSNESDGNFLIHDSESYVSFDDIGKEGIDSYDAANEENFKNFLENTNIKTDMVAKIYPLSLYVPLLSVKYRKIGFSDSQIYTEGVSQKGHCWGMDPFISLSEDNLVADRQSALSIEKRVLLLNSQASGRSVITSITRNVSTQQND